MRIRPLRTHAEFMDAEQLQRDVWDFPDREIIPLNELVVAQRTGGYVFGAFEGRKMAGFAFGVAALKGLTPYHYSRMLGVRPRWQNTGIGVRMKWHQREVVLERGLNLIRWTFDPLQGRNARLNVSKLGVIARDYVVNIYGGSESRFNRGVGSDRFVVEWWIRSPRVMARRRGPGGIGLDDASRLAGVLEVNERGHPGPLHPARGRRVRVEIPWDIDAIKATDLPLARRWRRATREAFLRLFRAGYVICDFAPDPGRRGVYVLAR